MIEWALIYYEPDGEPSFFTNEDGSPDEAPREKVMASAHMDDRTGFVTEVSDIGYWGWRSDLGRWKAIYNEQGWASFIRQEPWPLTVFGWEVSDEDFSGVMKAAEAAMQRPKTAWRQRERRVG